MPSDANTVGVAGLRFFGNVSASISHEIKNALAIINENSGLIKDYTVMTEKGLELNPHQVGAKADKITAQVARADAIVKKMNRFAHSIDQERQEINPNNILELMVALFERLAAMKSIRLELSTASESVSITTAPFFLENLVWLCLAFALKVVEEGRVLKLGCEKTEKGALICFKQLGKLSTDMADRFPDTAAASLADALQADIFADSASGKLTIALPEEIE